MSKACWHAILPNTAPCQPQLTGHPTLLTCARHPQLTLAGVWPPSITQLTGIVTLQPLRDSQATAPVHIIADWCCRNSGANLTHPTWAGWSVPAVTSPLPLTFLPLAWALLQQNGVTVRTEQIICIFSLEKEVKSHNNFPFYWVTEEKERKDSYPETEEPACDMKGKWESDTMIRQQKRDHTIFFLNQELNPQLKNGIRSQVSPSDFSINCHDDCKPQFATHGHLDCLVTNMCYTPAADWPKFWHWCELQQRNLWRSPYIHTHEN